MNVYEDIIAGLNEAIEYEKGKGKARTVKLTVAPIPDFSAEEIRSLRQDLKMTQGTFAAVMGVSSKTVEAWEAGTNIPLGTARRMLGLLKEDNSIPAKYNLVGQ